MQDPITEHNQKFWKRSGVFTEYLTEKRIHPSEALLFLKYSQAVLGKRILDLGCGGGRTSQVLRQAASHYVGIDSCEQMIELCRRQYLDTEFHVCSSEDLHIFPDASFDVVLFSFNGIDCMGHGQRLQSFQETRRVLKNGGLYIFSSHNRRCERVGNPPRLRFVRNPITQINLLFQFLCQRHRHLKNKSKEIHAKHYDVLNDPGHDFLFLIYYIDPQDQITQAQEAGFEILEMVDAQGERLKFHDDAKHSAWIYYLARKC